MNNNQYNKGQLGTGKGSADRYTSSELSRGERISSVAIIASILALAIITCTFFALFGEGELPVFNPLSTTTTLKQGHPINPDAVHPYATVTDKTNFIAHTGGTSLHSLGLYSDYAILINVENMSTLAYKNADSPIYPASMTKVMTVVTALDFIEDLDDGYIITKEILSRVDDTSSTAWLSSCVGGTVSVRDLLYGITYMSGADSVICLIDYLNLTEAQFVERMNDKADEIGLKNTVFGGAIGMDYEENQTTCRDIAGLMAYAMENPLCRELFGGLTYRLDFVEMTYSNSTLQKTLTNMGLTPSTVVDGYTLLGAKSGLETNAGYCLVSYIQNDETGELFVLVTAKASKAAEYPYNQNTIHDMKKILNFVKP